MRRRTAHAQDDQQQRERLLRPPDRTFRQQVRDVFWNSQNKTCLTRTPLNWLTITIYYIIFLSCILSIFIAAMLLVYYKMNGRTPQYILNDSPVGSAPHLNYFPMSESRSLLWLSPERSYNNYVHEIEGVLNEYKKANSSFNDTDFGQCSKAPYGYDKNTPCIFLRINRMIMWKPTPYKSGDELPKDLPDSIVEAINSSSTPMVWVSCEGTSPKDRDHIKPSSFSFQGPQGFDTSNFPFNMQRNYIDSVVSIMLENLPKKILCTFTCSAWSKGVDPKKSQVDVNLYLE